MAAFAPGFSAELVARGYRPRSAAAQLALMADVSRWLADHGLDERDLSEARVEELMAHGLSGPRRCSRRGRWSRFDSAQRGRRAARGDGAGSYGR